MVTKTKRKSKTSSKAITKAIRINKSDAIRQMAEQMSQKGIRPRGYLIIKALAKKKIKVASQHVSYALNRLSVKNSINCTINDLISVRDFINKIGSLKKAEKAIKIYKKFKK